MNGIIVGIQYGNLGKTDDVYRLVIYNKIDNKIDYLRKAVDKQNLLRLLAAGQLKLDNAAIVNNNLKGTTGDLNRFKSDKLRPMVVLSEIVANDKIIGYRLATYEGTIKAVRLKDVIAYCERVSPEGIPFQNAMYVPAKDNQRAHLRAYPGQTFRKEVVEQNRSKIAQPAKTNTKENAKQLNKLEEIFTPAQIEQLKLGKIHGVDIRVYGNSKLTAKQMEQLRLALEDGVNPKAFADPAFTDSVMHALRLNAKYGVDIAFFVNPKFNSDQVYVLSTGYLSGIDISKFADPEMSATEMDKQRIFLESQLWKEEEAKPMSE